MSGGFVSETQGKGSVGKFRQNNVGDLADWDGVSFCDFDPETGEPAGLLLNYLTLSSVLRVKEGDLLRFEMSNSPPSTLCFKFIDNQSFNLRSLR